MEYGAISTGTNNALKKTKGNLIERVKIIIFPGLSVGGTDKIMLKHAKEKAPIIIPAIITNRFKEPHNEKKIKPNNKGGKAKIVPNRKDPHTSPKRIVLMETGQVINRSSVFWRVSQGNTTGPIDAAVKNSTIAINPEVK
jgi:hypothetical protein